MTDLGGRSDQGNRLAVLLFGQEHARVLKIGAGSSASIIKVASFMPNSAPAKRRKPGSNRPDVRRMLLDAARDIICEEGYAAATARKIADRVGLKHQAIFYYFGSQDELLVAVYQNFARSYTEVLTKALASSTPISAMWNVIKNPDEIRLSLEFMALANHNAPIRAEIAKNALAVRKLERESIEQHLRKRGIEPRLSPRVVSILTNSLGRLLVQEAALGIHEGHDEILALAEASFVSFEEQGDDQTEASILVEKMEAGKVTTKAAVTL